MNTQEERIMRTVPPSRQKIRLDQFVAQSFDGFSRADARKAIEQGQIWINGQVCRILSRDMVKDDRVTWLVLPEKPPPSPEIALAFPEASPGFDWRPYGGPPEYLFRDGYMAIINKQADMPIEPTGREDLRVCLRQVEATQRAEGLLGRRLYATAAHRLDAGASGAVAFALRKQAAQRLSQQFADRTASRLYHVLVIGVIKEKAGVVDAPIRKTGPGIRRGVGRGADSKGAITHFRVLERFADATLLEARLETGRTHQIRVHMAHLGHPLIGDWLYSDDTFNARCPTAPRMMLHAHQLTLTHPTDGQEITCEAPLDQAYAGYLDALRSA